MRGWTSSAGCWRVAHQPLRAGTSHAAAGQCQAPGGPGISCNAEPAFGLMARDNNGDATMSFLLTALLGFMVGLVARAVLPGTHSRWASS